MRRGVCHHSETENNTQPNIYFSELFYQCWFRIDEARRFFASTVVCRSFLPMDKLATLSDLMKESSYVHPDLAKDFGTRKHVHST